MYNITFISDVTTPQRAYACEPRLKDFNVKFFKCSDSTQEIIRQAHDTDFLIIDAMASADDELISSLPQLKLIQSEGVGYQGVDISSAHSHGVYVCNNKGINDTAVAETAVMLILACLKNITQGSNDVYDGKQIQAKMTAFGVVRELSQCTVGLVGFGDIARQTARLLNAFGANVVYCNRTRYPQLEEEYNVKYVSLDELLAISDFVSLHVAVCDDTRFMADKEFFDKMKSTAYLINTARGDLVDSVALHNAVQSGLIAGAGLDVLYPEPVTSDNIMLDSAIANKLVLLPHIAGITDLTVKKIYSRSVDNIVRIINNEKPQNIVY